MKKIFFLFFTLFTFNLFAKEIPVTSKIEQVTVFRSGAQIKRTATVSLSYGVNEVVFTDLPSGFNESSIVVKVDAKLDINTVSTRTNFSKTIQNSPEYQTLKQQSETLQAKKENENVILDTWKEEESLIVSNKKVGGENAGLSQEQLAKIADLYRVRLLEVKQKILETKRKITELDKQLAKVTAQMNELSTNETVQKSGEIVVLLNAPMAMSGSFEIVYIDPRAEWQTGFDLKLESLQKPLTLINKGKVSQSTGEDWNDVSLVLSTGNPNMNLQFPMMTPWFLYYMEYYANQQYQNNDMVKQKAYSNARPMDMGQVRAEAASAKENITFTEYTLASKMTILANHKVHEIKLKNNDIDAQYEYLAIPKLDKSVFLRANIADWEQYNLSSGEMKMYFEGTYIGTSYLDINNASDTLSLSLGADIAIVCKREKIKDEKKTSFFSTKKIQYSGYEITLKNNKSQAIEVVLKDQIPLLTDSQMEITAEELSGGKHDKETGIIEWRIKLQPGEQVKKRLVFSVKIPKDKRVSLGR